MRSRPQAVVMPRPGPTPGPEPEPAPVEYAVAVDRYLAEASLGAASRRDAGRLDLRGAGAPAGPAARHGGGWIRWRDGTGEVLGWLLAGRTCGPVFLTDRRAPAGAAPADVCPVTGRARMSYRRAAEIFTAATRPLDPAGRGWTLGQLRQAGREDRAAAG